MQESGNAASSTEKALIDLAVEGWRLARLFGRVLTKLDAGEGIRYTNQIRYFTKRIDETLQTAGMRLVNLEGQPYDTGLPATALNIEDFSPDDRLYVEQMLNPVIMGSEGIVKTGTVILKKVA